MNTPAPDTCITADLHHAAFLQALGFPLLSLENRGGRAVFIFPEPAQEAILKLHQGRDEVSARALLNALRDLKGLLAQRRGDSR